MAALPGYEWDVVGDGQLWPYPEKLADHFQTWLRDPSTGHYRMDVFREPHNGDRWVCRRDTSITLAYDELILRTRDGIPFVVPEVALLFKAKHTRPKDQRDFDRVVPAMSEVQRTRLRDWLAQIHPEHPWGTALSQQSR